MKKIIIAEDDKFLGQAYRLKLTNSGFSVLVVNDGQQLLDQIEEFAPDLIILDLVMPVLDGFSALEKIKSNPLLKNLPVIIASNLGQKEDIDRTKALGVADFVVKSDLSLTELVDKINKLL